MKQVRSLRPSSVRTGMFCRFGSEEDSRPVVVEASANEVWTRPVRCETAVTSASE